MQDPIYLRQENDTASPRSVVPVYFVHAIDAPFCTNPHCICHQSLIEVSMLLLSIDEEVLSIQKAESFRERAS